MSKVTVDDADIMETGERDYVLYFDPPLKAFMTATNEAGDEVRVEAEIDAFYAKDNDYSFSYVDPDCDACLISDFCKYEELEFVQTHEWSKKNGT